MESDGLVSDEEGVDEEGFSGLGMWRVMAWSLTRKVWMKKASQVYECGE